MIQKLVTKHRLPPYEEFDGLIFYMQREQASCTLNLDYDRGDMMRQGIEILREEEHRQKAIMKREMTKSERDERLERAKSKRSYVESVWNDRMAKFRQLKEEEIGRVSSRHAEEDSQFAEQWEDDRALTKFNKPTSRLLNLRKIERTQAVLGDFAGAKRTRGMADEEENQEKDTAEGRAVGSMRLAWEAMKVRQERELECAEAFYARREAELLLERESDLKKADLVVQKCLSPPLIRSPAQTGPVRRRAPVTTPTTPRTRSSLREFKTKSGQGKLQLEPLNVRGLTGGDRPRTTTRIVRRTTKRFPKV